ncbi:hypothetical protein BpHYR1_000972 [Brachionus plicatilis]|uniref:Uncharacterized protein n=1 Tax=Brachionus plicatilis TaxID=10195 RepID=A0A3M7T3W4_BRAPC|nr:hypothetical protein BpHYR1_000972 [Brachionus plicatilis]
MTKERVVDSDSPRSHLQVGDAESATPTSIKSTCFAYQNGKYVDYSDHGQDGIERCHMSAVVISGFGTHELLCGFVGLECDWQTEWRTRSERGPLHFDERQTRDKLFELDTRPNMHCEQTGLQKRDHSWTSYRSSIDNLKRNKNEIDMFRKTTAIRSFKKENFGKRQANFGKESEI